MKKVLDIHLETGAAHLEHEDGSHYRCNKFSLILRQFTGLVGYKGEEWYVGDIIKGETLVPMEIIEHQFGFGVRYLADKKWHEEQIDREFYKHLVDENTVKIGNIYEHPKLLTK